MIQVKDVTKKFKIYKDKGKTMKERVTAPSRNAYEEKWVLKGISFRIRRGESVGLIGPNGCGKSTTLKLLTRIMYPDSGSVEIKGRVSSLLELGAGFHPDMTGVENIYINASIFGLTKKEIDEKLDDIIEFAELGDYINNPVRTYSSGMYMRLAFAVAINVNADILLVDEILAVGDINFQTKCFNKLMEIKRQGTTIVLVSHSTAQIESVCDRSIWIKDGKIEMDGEPRKVHEAYMIFMGSSRKRANTEKQEKKAKKDNTDNKDHKENTEEKKKEPERAGTGEVRIQQARTLNSEGIEQKVFSYGEDVTFRIDYKVFEKSEDIHFGLAIIRNDRVQCYGTSMQAEGIPQITLTEDGTAYVRFPSIGLLKGEYFIDISVVRRTGEMLDYCAGVAPFEIYQGRRQNGVAFLPHTWELPVFDKTLECMK